MPYISVVIPVYNSEDYLYDCLNSVSIQSFHDIEVIVVDDGSTDSSPKICDEYALKDSRFKVVHKINEGVSVARNVGIDYSIGKWVTFIDSDDKVLPDYLLNMVKLIDGNTQFVACDVDEGESCDVISEVLTKDSFLKHSSLFVCSPWNKLFKLDMIKAFGISFPKGLSRVEDNIFYWNYLLNCDYISVGKVNNYCYNRRENSLVHYIPDIEELKKTSQIIIPLYDSLSDKISFEKVTENRIDKYLFNFLFRGMLRSRCMDWSYTSIYNAVEIIVNQLLPISKRIFKAETTTYKLSLMSRLAKMRCVTLFSAYLKINNYLKR